MIALQNVYDSLLSNGDNIRKIELWIEYLNFLVKIKKDNQYAQKAYENALKHIEPNMKEKLISEYNAITQQSK